METNNACIVYLLAMCCGLCMSQTTRAPSSSTVVPTYNISTTPTPMSTSLLPSSVIGVTSTSAAVIPTTLSQINQGNRNNYISTTVGPINQGNRSNSTQDGSVWLRCVGQSRSREESAVTSLLISWCQHNETIVGCLSKDFSTSKLNNALDFFVNLTYNQTQLRTASSQLCTKYQEKRDKLSCATSANQSHANSCLGSFSSGLAHVYGLHSEKKLPLELLRDVACDIMLQTTLCLRDSYTSCDEEVQSLLVNYYSLFTNESCIAKAGQNSGALNPETVVDKCAKEAAEMMTSGQPEPVTLRDFLIMGLRTDCKTYPIRYGCYSRELGNITNFRDFWLSLTFDYDNAMASQKIYCDQIESTVISRINENCFTQAHPNLASCEIGFGRELETIRDEWFGNSNLDGLELQTLACRTSVARAACLNHAMQPCGSEVASSMAVSEMGILPDICRQLLVPEDMKNKSDVNLTNEQGRFSSNNVNGPAINRPGTISTEYTSTMIGHRSGSDNTPVYQHSTSPSDVGRRNGTSVYSDKGLTGNVRPDGTTSKFQNNGSNLKTDPLYQRNNISMTTPQLSGSSSRANFGQINIIVVLFLAIFRSFIFGVHVD